MNGDPGSGGSNGPQASSGVKIEHKRAPPRKVRTVPEAPPATDRTRGDGRPPTPSPNGAESATELSIDAIKKALGGLAGPPAVLTATMYWLGYKRTEAFWASFGVSPSLLGFSTTDYVIRAVDTAFPFLTVIFVLLVVGALLHRQTMRRLERMDYFFTQVLAFVLLTLALFVFAPVALADLFYTNLEDLDLANLTKNHVLVGPAFGFAGVISASYALYLREETRRRQDSAGSVVGQPQATGHRSFRLTSHVITGAALSLSVLMLFWLTDRLATATGHERAREVLDQDLPTVVIYSKNRLQFEGDGLTEHRLEQHDAKFRYQYTGMRFLLHSAGRYFLFPDGTARVLVLPESSDMRLEYRPG